MCWHLYKLSLCWSHSMRRFFNENWLQAEAWSVVFLIWAIIRDKAAREGVSINSVYKILAVILNVLRFMLVCYQMLQIKKRDIIVWFCSHFTSVYRTTRHRTATSTFLPLILEADPTLGRRRMSWIVITVLGTKSKSQVHILQVCFSVFEFSWKCGSRTKTFSTFMLVKDHFNKDTTCCVRIQKIGSQWIKSLLPINLFKGPPSDRRCVRNYSFTISCVSPLTHGQYTKRWSHLQSSVGIVQLAEKVGVQLAYIQTFCRIFYGEQISKEAAAVGLVGNVLIFVREAIFKGNCKTVVPRITAHDCLPPIQISGFATVELPSWNFGLFVSHKQGFCSFVRLAFSRL